MAALETSKGQATVDIEPKKQQLCDIRATFDKTTASWKAEETKLREAHASLVKVITLPHATHP